MITSQIIDDLPSAEKLYPQWDELAIDNALPMSSPAWMLAWWRHLAPHGAQLRIVAVHDRDRLIGLAPLYCESPRRGRPTTYRLLAANFSTSVAPVALRDRAWEVATAIDSALVDADPRPDLIALEPTPLDSPWLLALRDRWPGAVRPLVFQYDLQSMPVVSLHDDSLETWLTRRSAKFRSGMRRLERLLGEEGGATRLSTQQTLTEDIASFARLHAQRWRGRGQSRLSALGDRLSATLIDVGQALLDDERSDASGGPRLRLRIIEIAGETICADFSIAGGGEIVGFNLGWDERFKRLSPPLLAFLEQIRQGFSCEDRCFQLGWGSNAYKRRFANGDAPVAWNLMLPAGSRLPIALGHTAPLAGSAWMRERGKRLFTTEQIDRLRPLARRMPR
ncbi:MAG TPA: GNAT family N-acetyltransferase [Solirubrobacteraceae bacterium]|jgi:CelD/BcsL family acetyltransferase involved in cellulose biosynthesis|nr:GNAT family N-acetyltransferase [Solirubrobacteraceae bacterium]